MSGHSASARPSAEQPRGRGTPGIPRARPRPQHPRGRVSAASFAQALGGTRRACRAPVRRRSRRRPARRRRGGRGAARRMRPGPLTSGRCPGMRALATRSQQLAGSTSSSTVVCPRRASRTRSDSTLPPPSETTVRPPRARQQLAHDLLLHGPEGVLAARRELLGDRVPEALHHERVAVPGVTPRRRRALGRRATCRRP